MKTASRRAGQTRHRGDESEIGNDDFIAGLNIQKKSRHIHAMRTGMVNKAFGTPKLLFKQVLHFLVKGRRRKCVHFGRLA